MKKFQHVFSSQPGGKLRVKKKGGSLGRLAALHDDPRLAQLLLARGPKGPRHLRLIASNSIRIAAFVSWAFGRVSRACGVHPSATYKVEYHVTSKSQRGCENDKVDDMKPTVIP